MLPASLQRILATVPDDAVVLDIGGWGKPLPRADWVMDLMPYEPRGLYGYETHDPERFTAATWIQRDICDREPFPFADKSVDFVICSHTLEDIRDPIWVCQEMQRIGRAGYIETPSRLEEQTYGVQGPWVGWGHHRWLVEECDGGLEFVFKHHIICGRERDRLPEGFLDGVAPEERMLQLWWTDHFECRERVLVDAAELDAYTADFVAAQLARRPARSGPPPRSGVGSARSRVRSAITALRGG
jgi:SAM-dependent methyltransferase